MLCCAVPWQWYPSRHLYSLADQAACTSGADSLPSLKTHALGVRVFCFGHRKAFHETAAVILEPGRRTAFLLRCA